MTTQYLKIADGTLTYEEHGGAQSGQVVLMAPGIGDLRAEYRLLAPLLAAAGLRPVAMDLRGMSDSSTNWAEYTPEAVGRDMLALAAHLQAGPVWLMGTSMAAASAVWAAVESPALVRGIILAGPSLEDAQLSAMQALVLRVAFVGPWKVAAWMMFYQSLYPHAKPADFDAYCATLRANLRERGRFATQKAFLNASKAAAAARIGQVQQPALVVMGDSDPDYADPAAQAQSWAAALGGEALIVANSGHYPHVDAADRIAPEITRWIETHASLTGNAPVAHGATQPAPSHMQLA